LLNKKRLPFDLSHSHADFPFDLIHCDIWGPFSIKSNIGCSFFLTIVDDHSRYTWVYLLHHKSQTRDFITSFFHLVETKFNTKIKCVRSDNGPKFCMFDFFAYKGTLHQFSCVETPQQNAIVERKHQHLLNVARSFRFQSYLPFSFWGECVLTATHLINRIPTPPLSHKSPFEILFSKPPSYSHLRVFGCLCYASTFLCSKTKFDSRAKPFVFVGYPPGMKGYTLYDLHTKSFVVSWHVVFHEHVFPFASKFLFTSNGHLVSDLAPAPIPDSTPLSPASTSSLNPIPAAPGPSESSHSSPILSSPHILRKYSQPKHHP